MNIKKKLLNPFVLAAQGFVAGAILFWSTVPVDNERVAAIPAVDTAAISASVTA